MRTSSESVISASIAKAIAVMKIKARCGVVLSKATPRVSRLKTRTADNHRTIAASRGPPALAFSDAALRYGSDSR